MNFHFAVNIQKLSPGQFLEIADTTDRAWGRVDGAEAGLITGSGKDSTILSCLLKIREDYPEARFGFSQHAVLAKGLSKIAEKGEILISEDIEKLVMDSFKITCLGMLSIQGMTNEILVCRLDEPLKEVKCPASKPLAPHISRRNQIESLEHHLSVAKALLVVCPTGGGKTVFLDEVAESWQGKRATYRTACPSYMRGVTFQPIIDLTGQLLEIDGARTVEEKQKQVEQKLNELNVADLATSYLTILDLLSLTDEESILAKVALKARVEVLTDTLAEVIRRRSWQIPVAIVVEDVENMDASSTAFMQQLMTKLADENICFVFCSYLSHTNLSGVQEFELNEIAKEDLARLIEETVGETMVLPPTTPLHVVQYIRLYREEKTAFLYRQYQGETSIAGFALSYHDLKTMIKRRLDILPDQKRDLLSNLAVIGIRILPAEFPLEPENIALLDQFVTRGYLKQERDYYTFTNPILHEALYDLAGDKKNMHLRLADYYVRLPGHEEYAAFHYRMGENFRKAIEHLMNSARQAGRKGAYESAIEYYNQALELCQRKREAAELELVIALNEGLADLYRSLDEEDKALKYYKVVLDSYKEILKE